ncbi:hypothetical protein M422DRAFT_53433 [Sphaerobolus stellatus SS14]|uniref:Uncharacterized protein n=1 Tax=Sphaerobolus stellatus (strain SS14) TaxID=990650 RepID=A0A0C9V1L5_SPHS4|nr:hypothetical protein M422DRAFT_53433 [Sphaerobolus stellatus SS14]
MSHLGQGQSNSYPQCSFTPLPADAFYGNMSTQQPQQPYASPHTRPHLHQPHRPQSSEKVSNTSNTSHAYQWAYGGIHPPSTSARIPPPLQHNMWEHIVSHQQLPSPNNHVNFYESHKVPAINSDFDNLEWNTLGIHPHGQDLDTSSPETPDSGCDSSEGSTSGINNAKQAPGVGKGVQKEKKEKDFFTRDEIESILSAMMAVNPWKAGHGGKLKQWQVVLEKVQAAGKCMNRTAETVRNKVNSVIDTIEVSATFLLQFSLTSICRMVKALDHAQMWAKCRATNRKFTNLSTHELTMPQHFIRRPKRTRH